ncbi:MAG: sulfatase-like hydrolase/transferase, partial [Trueperaceae bacterium]|nr:sulfatase-like hydrolase/transferase [Trueperaceae bacterium]
RKADSSTPFALFLSWGPPHDPWTDDNTPEPFRLYFDERDFPNPPNYKPEDDPYGDDWAKLSAEERKQLPKWRKNYYAQVANLDWNLGRLLETLKETGLENDTLVVFTSDHGEMFGAQGRRAKNIFYEEACRIPLLLRWPGHIPAGVVSDACISTIDLQPTLCELLGLSPRPDAQGMNLAKLVLGQEGDEPEAALMMICGATAAWRDGHEWRALRDKHFTYAVYKRDGKADFPPPL